ncbi:MAG: DUF4395 family protein [Chloroflexota bacterium]
MTIVRVPTPLRPYTGGLREIQVDGGTVGAALADLARRCPGLRPHLFDHNGGLRPFVNLLVNDQDVRALDGDSTRLRDGDRLMIVPSIAGGRADGSDLRLVDHAALRTNQAMTIGLLIAAFVVDARGLVGFVALAMLLGTALGMPGFLPVYGALRKLRVLKPDVLRDHPQPHRFAQGLGSAVLLASLAGFATGALALAWLLVGIVVALAALNLFGGLCLGCAAYYWLSRLGVRGFDRTPPPGTTPGRRPPATV